MRQVGILPWAVSIGLGMAGSGAVAGQESTSTKAAIGEIVPEFQFRELVTGGDGRRKLSELRGQPVLIVNWTDTDFGRGASDRAEDVAESLTPDGLVVVLLETHNMKEREIEAAAMRLYPGSNAWFASNQKLPIEYEDNGPPPDIALIGVDGTLLIAGSYTSDFGKVTKLTKEELKRMKSGWGEHDAAKEARALAFGKRSLAEAKVLLDAALAAAPEQRELLEAQGEVETRRASWEASARTLLEGGQPLRAFETAQALSEASRGEASWGASAAGLLEEFTREPVAREIELDRRLEKLLKPLAKKPPKESDAAKLREFATGAAAGTRVGERALHLAEVAALAAGA